MPGSGLQFIWTNQTAELNYFDLKITTHISGHCENHLVSSSSFCGCKMSEWKQHPSYIQAVSSGYIHIYKYITLYMYIYVCPHVMLLQSWIYFSSGNFLTTFFSFPPGQYCHDNHLSSVVHSVAQIPRLEQRQTHNWNMYSLSLHFTHTQVQDFFWPCWIKHW